MQLGPLHKMALVISALSFHQCSMLTDCVNIILQSTLYIQYVNSPHKRHFPKLAGLHQSRQMVFADDLTKCTRHKTCVQIRSSYNVHFASNKWIVKECVHLPPKKPAMV